MRFARHTPGNFELGKSVWFVFQLAIVISTGAADDATATENAAMTLRQNSVGIIGVYIGAMDDDGYTQLEQIVSVTTDLASLRVSSVSNLPVNLRLLVSVACVPTIGS